MDEVVISKIESEMANKDLEGQNLAAAKQEVEVARAEAKIEIEQSSNV